MEARKNRREVTSWRQGDVLIMKVNSIPIASKPVDREKGMIVLAYGEATNHHHAIYHKSAKGFLSGDDLYLDLEKQVDITHQEHGTVTLEPGKYRVIHQVEYRRKEIVRVVD